MCIVEVEGQRNPVPSCTFPVGEGMEVRPTRPELLRRLRRDIVELLLDNHPQDCQTCERDGNCELQNLAYELGVRARLFEGERKQLPDGRQRRPVRRDAEKCILCGRCVRVCAEVQGVYNLRPARARLPHRGRRRPTRPTWTTRSASSAASASTSAPRPRSWRRRPPDRCWEALADPDMHVVVQTAPSIRAAIGEGFGFRPGTPVTGKMVTALRRLGFDAVFDTNFGADLTIVEEAHEFLEPAAEGRAPADDHLLLAGLGQLPGEVLPGADPATPRPASRR